MAIVRFANVDVVRHRLVSEIIAPMRQRAAAAREQAGAGAPPPRAGGRTGRTWTATVPAHRGDGRDRRVALGRHRSRVACACAPRRPRLGPGGPAPGPVSIRLIGRPRGARPQPRFPRPGQADQRAVFPPAGSVAGGARRSRAAGRRGDCLRDHVCARRRRRASRSGPLRHLVVHGVLHLLGHDHGDPPPPRRMEGWKPASSPRSGSPIPT